MADITELTEKMAEMASAFIDNLSDQQLEKASLPFDDEKTRRTWYFTPTPRAGLPIREMTPEQHQRVRRLLAAGLSEAGYNYAAVVFGQEHMVDYHQGFLDRGYGDLPNTRTRDLGNYCVAVFGTPGDEAGWGWTIGGHHLSLHYTVRNGAISPTPAFFGAEPSRTTMPGGKVLKPLAAEEDYARELFALLDPDQRTRAVLSPIAGSDIVQMNRPRVEDGALYTVGGPGPGGQGLREKLGLTPELDDKLRYSLTPKGLPVNDMKGPQQDMFRQLVSAYFSHMPEAIVGQYGALLEPDRLAGTSFAWAGSDAVGQPHYYRIQGERLLIEYDCTQDEANHTHSVWRDPEGDFGDDLLARHYEASHST